MRIAQIINTNNITDITPEVMQDDGKIKLLPSDKWKKYKWEDFRVFCHLKARYGIHTLEQQLFLSKIISGKDTIEIGAGSGDLGSHLHVQMTDSKQQENPIIAMEYAAALQPTIKYPDDVEKIEALDAVYKYKPKFVIASWITTYAPQQTSYGSNPFGIRENKIIDLVDTFIIIGNIDIHGDKPIMKLPHEEYYFDWIVSRARDQTKNRIWIWSK